MSQQHCAAGNLVPSMIFRGQATAIPGLLPRMTSLFTSACTSLSEPNLSLSFTKSTPLLSFPLPQPPLWPVLWRTPVGVWSLPNFYFPEPLLPSAALIPAGTQLDWHWALRGKSPLCKKFFPNLWKYLHLLCFSCLSKCLSVLSLLGTYVSCSEERWGY